MQIENRARLIERLPKNGVVVELGVAAAKFAAQMLTLRPDALYYGIDRWSDHHDTDEMIQAIDTLSPFPHTVLRRDTFDKALPSFPDESLDMVYIDGYAHTGQEGGETLQDWWPKVKSGGIFAGHDYDAEYQPTVDAVNAFVVARNLSDAFELIEGDRYASWCITKPS